MIPTRGNSSINCGENADRDAKPEHHSLALVPRTLPRHPLKSSGAACGELAGRSDRQRDCSGRAGQFAESSDRISFTVRSTFPRPQRRCLLEGSSTRSDHHAEAPAFKDCPLLPRWSCRSFLTASPSSSSSSPSHPPPPPLLPAHPSCAKSAQTEGDSERQRLVAIRLPYERDTKISPIIWSLLSGVSRGTHSYLAHPCRSIQSCASCGGGGRRRYRRPRIGSRSPVRERGQRGQRLDGESFCALTGE